MNIPIEQEDSNQRLNNSKVFKERNRNFGTYKDVLKEYPTNDIILKQIFQVRYSKTLGDCPDCGMPFQTFRKVSNKPAFKCKCGYKIYPLKGTHLEQSRTKLMDIVEFVYELFRNKHGTPATALERRFGDEYETCRNNLHVISDWMGFSNEKKGFTKGSILEIDEVYPKVETGLGPYYKFKKGAGSERTHGVLVITERDNLATNFFGITKAFVFDKTDAKAVEKIIRKYIKPEDNHTIYTDESTYYAFLRYSGYSHIATNHSKNIYKVGESATNMVEGYNERVKTLIHRVYLGVSPKYLQLYLNRITFNHSNRSKSFFQVLNILFDSMPGLYDEVERTFIRKRKNNKRYIEQAA
ncbi:MAG: IS1595 family transposase [Nitrososphaeraceae archaeon]